MSRFLQRGYRVALRLLTTADLRASYGDEIELVFADVVRQARRRGGWWAVVRVSLREFRQLIGVARALDRGPPPLPRRQALTGRRLVDRCERLLPEGRTAFRALRRYPLYSVTSITIVAVGVGLNTAVFSAARVSVAREIPIPDVDRLAVLRGSIETPGWWSQSGLSARELVAVRDEASLLEDVSIFSLWGHATLTGLGPAERWRVMFVSADYFPMLDARPALGSLFRSPSGDDTELGPQVVLSHGAWQRRLGGDSSIVGQPLTLSGRGYTVAGVTAPDFFDLARPPQSVDAWIPIDWSADVLGDDVLRSLTQAHFWGIARLADGVTREAADAEIQNVVTGFQAKYPVPVPRTIRLMPMGEYFYGSFERPMIAMIIGAVFVVIVCGANLGALVVVRTRARRRELALRSALGGSRAQVTRGVLLEAVAIGAVGVVLGGGLASLALRWFELAYGDQFLRFGPLEVDLPALVTTGAAAVAFAAVGAWIASRDTVGGRLMALRTSNRATMSLGRWPTRLIIAGEAMFAVVVLGGAVLGVRSLRLLEQAELGYDPVRLYAVRVDLTASAHDTPEGRAEFASQLIPRLAEVPGVERVGVIGPDMLGRSVTHVNLTAARFDPLRAEHRHPTQWISVAPGTLRAAGIDLLEGRDVTWEDDASGEFSVILGERAARRLWPGQSAVGKRLYVNGNRRLPGVVVGVARETRHQNRWARRGVIGDVYFPFAQRPSPRLGVLLRLQEGAPLPRITTLAGVVAGIDDRVPVFDVAPMSARLRSEESGLRLVVHLTSVYALIAVILTLFGVASLLAHAVQVRRAEIAIRMTMGASGWRVRWPVVRGLVVPLAAGLAVGSVLAAGLGRSLAGVFYRVTPTDLPTYIVAATAILFVGGLTSWWAARRATAIDPLEAIRLD